MQQTEEEVTSMARQGNKLVIEKLLSRRLFVGTFHHDKQAIVDIHTHTHTLQGKHT